jgi:L-alanine-DL-glutamate epimerase-like enolase superfamily enzyme
VTRRLTISHDRFALRGTFTISRGSRTHGDVLTVTVEKDGAVGRGECTPYPRYGESMESVQALIELERAAVEAGCPREDLLLSMGAGAARNALDCALWDLEAKRADRRAWQLAGLPEPKPITTAYTLSLDTPEAMGEAARVAADRPLLKVKLGGAGDPERIRSVRAGAPKARLIVDANEAWAPEQVRPFLEVMADCGVELVEQPLPAHHDAMLAEIPHPVPIGADESVHDSATLEPLVGRYDVVNLKLDKTGGLTEALRFVARAEELGLGLMVGCMLGSSLAMAPAVLVAQRARFVDLDAPLLLAEDRSPALRYEGSTVFPPEPELWG